MSITVSCELRVRQGHAEAITGRAIEQLSLPAHRVVGRRHARLYQHLEDPTRLLYVAEWESREAFDAYRLTAPMPGQPEQFVAMPVCRIYRRLALFEHVLTPVHIAYADTVEGPAETHAARRDLLLAYYRASVRDRRGLVLLMTNEHIDQPPELLVVSAWQSPPAASAPELPGGEHLLDQLRAAGGTVNRFVGRQLVDTAAGAA